MFLNKGIAATAFVAAVAFSTSVGAVTITTDHVDGANDPVEGMAVALSGGDVMTMDIDTAGADVGSGAGHASFGFTATEELVTLETNSLNPDNGFLGTSVIWSTEEDGGGTIIASLNGNTDVQDGSMTVVFDIGETLWLTALWEDIAEPGADFDLRVTAAVPVPAGMLLMGTALAGFGIARRRKS